MSLLFLNRPCSKRQLIDPTVKNQGHLVASKAKLVLLNFGAKKIVQTKNRAGFYGCKQVAQSGF